MKRIIFLGIISAITAGIVCLPAFLSTSLGTKVTSFVVSKYTGEAIEIRSAQFSWNGPQVLEGIQWKDPSHAVSVDFNANLESSFSGLIFSSYFPIQIKGQSTYLHTSSPFEIQFVNPEAYSIQAHQLPTEVLGMFASLAQIPADNLPDFFGPLVDLNLVNESNNLYKLSLHSKHFNLDAKISIEGSVAKTVTPAKMNYKGIISIIEGSLDIRTKSIIAQSQHDISSLQNEFPRQIELLGSSITADSTLTPNFFGWDFQSVIKSTKIKDASLNITANIPSTFTDNQPTKIPFKAEATDSSFSIIATGKFNYPYEKTPFSDLNVTLDAANIPYYPELLGTSNNVEAEIVMNDDDGSGKAKVKIKSEKVHAEASLSVDENFNINGKEKAYFNASLTPQQAKSLIGNEYLKNIEIGNPISVRAEIESLSMPASFSSTDMMNAGIEGNLFIGPLDLLLPEKGEKLLFSALEGTFHKRADGLGTDISLKSKGGAAAINVQGILGTNTDLKIEASSLPTFALNAIGGFDRETTHMIYATVGSSLNISIHYKANPETGYITLAANSHTAQVQFAGELHPQHFTITQPLQAQIEMTPTFIDQVLVRQLPILEGAMKGEGHLRVRLEPNGVYIPLNPFNVDRVNIPSGVVQVDPLHMSPSSEIAGFLNMFVKNSNTPVSLISTPLYFNVGNGIANINRWDILLGSQFPLALWGSINFVKQKVNMVLGLTPRAVEIAFNISGLPSKHMLQLPVKGKFGEVSVDRRKIVAKIGGLIAQSRGTVEGLLLGTLLQAAGGTIKDGEAPLPTTNPLPWKTDSERSGPVATTLNIVEETVKKPVEVLQDTAGSLLNKFFQ